MFQPPAADPSSAEETFMRRSRMPVSAESVFAWHARPGALERLLPPWSGIRLLERRGGIETGARTVLSMPFGPFRFRWVAEHVDYEPNHLFRDVQAKGPFTKWDHLHLIEPSGARLSDLEDRITYVLPFGRLGRSLAGRFVRRDLERTFIFRHRTTCDDLAVHAARSRRSLRIGVTASGSLIGAALSPFLTSRRHRCTRCVDSPRRIDSRCRAFC
jgi:ligand-binding SRPBCC domain-containing protein